MRYDGYLAGRAAFAASHRHPHALACPLDPKIASSRIKQRMGFPQRLTDLDSPVQKAFYPLGDCLI